jgi:hypothetical protein
MTNKKLPTKIRNQLKKEKKILKNLKLKFPEIFRKCGKYPCCQAETKNGVFCTRPALTDKTYFQSLRCCYLCWQHALSYGVYGLLKISKAASTSHMDMDEYCYYFPDECDDMINTIKSWK